MTNVEKAAVWLLMLIASWAVVGAVIFITWRIMEALR